MVDFEVYGPEARPIISHLSRSRRILRVELRPVAIEVDLEGNVVLLELFRLDRWGPLSLDKCKRTQRSLNKYFAKWDKPCRDFVHKTYSGQEKPTCHPIPCKPCCLLYLDKQDQLKGECK